MSVTERYKAEDLRYPHYDIPLQAVVNRAKVLGNGNLERGLLRGAMRKYDSNHLDNRNGVEKLVETCDGLFIAPDPDGQRIDRIGMGVLAGLQFMDELDLPDDVQPCSLAWVLGHCLQGDLAQCNTQRLRHRTLFEYAMRGIDFINANGGAKSFGNLRKGMDDKGRFSPFMGGFGTVIYAGHSATHPQKFNHSDCDVNFDVMFP